MSRLPVGHTHEDIDSKFALIWKKTRSAFVSTISQYDTLATSATTSASLQSKMVDIYCVPDYSSFLHREIDVNFGRYSKTDLTQLQWIFEATAPCKNFPLGVKSFYRAYCQDKVVEIVDDPGSDVKFKCQTADVFTFPLPRRYKKSNDDLVAEGLNLTEADTPPDEDFVPGGYVLYTYNLL